MNGLELGRNRPASSPVVRVVERSVSGQADPLPPGSLIGDLFNDGSLGVWLDPNDRSTLFRDALGDVPVTEPDQRVRLIKDKSGNGLHMLCEECFYRVDSEGRGYIEIDGWSSVISRENVDLGGAQALTAYIGLYRVEDAGSAGVFSFRGVPDTGGQVIFNITVQQNGAIRAGLYTRTNSNSNNAIIEQPAPRAPQFEVYTTISRFDGESFLRRNGQILGRATATAPGDLLVRKLNVMSSGWGDEIPLGGRLYQFAMVTKPVEEDTTTAIEQLIADGFPPVGPENFRPQHLFMTREGGSLIDPTERFSMRAMLYGGPEAQIGERVQMIIDSSRHYAVTKGELISQRDMGPFTSSHGYTSSTANLLVRDQELVAQLRGRRSTGIVLGLSLGRLSAPRVVRASIIGRTSRPLAGGKAWIEVWAGAASFKSEEVAFGPDGGAVDIVYRDPGGVNRTMFLVIEADEADDGAEITVSRVTAAPIMGRHWYQEDASKQPILRQEDGKTWLEFGPGANMTAFGDRIADADRGVSIYAAIATPGPEDGGVVLANGTVEQTDAFLALLVSKGPTESAVGASVRLPGGAVPVSPVALAPLDNKPMVAGMRFTPRTLVATAELNGKQGDPITIGEKSTDPTADIARESGFLGFAGPAGSDFTGRIYLLAFRARYTEDGRRADLLPYFAARCGATLAP